MIMGAGKFLVWVDLASNHRALVDSLGLYGFQAVRTHPEIHPQSNVIVFEPSVEN
jgi:hypothetical protein